MRLIAAFVVFLVPLTALSQNAAEPLVIHDNAELSAVLAQDNRGRTLLLAPGRYEPLFMENGSAPAVIRSLDPGDPAILSMMSAENFDGLRIEDLMLSYVYAPAHEIWIRPFDFRSGRNLVLRNLTIVGDVPRDRGPADDGLGFGIGISIGGVNGVIVENCRISLFHRGIVMGGSSDVHVTGNEIVDIRSDGMNFVHMNRLWIQDNLIHSFDRSEYGNDHSDMIQFWTRNSEQPSQNVFIRRNILNAADGRATQSIFMRNEEVDRDRAGHEMFYRNITIEDNVIINAHSHGITVGETDGLVVRNNTLVQLPEAADGDPSRPVTIPRISVSSASRDVIILNNIIPRPAGYDHPTWVAGYGKQTDWRVGNNLEIQNHSLLASNHYNLIFEGMPQGAAGDPDTYRYAPDGPAGSGGLGARILAAPQRRISRSPLNQLPSARRRSIESVSYP